MGKGDLMKPWILRIGLAVLLLSTVTGCMYQANTKAQAAWESDLQLRQQIIKRCQEASMLYANLADKPKTQSPIYQYAPGKTCPTG